MNRLGDFYVDTKGADDNGFDRLNGDCYNSELGTGCEAGTLAPRSPLATGNRSAYARTADESSLPPEVEQLRHGCVISAPTSSDASPRKAGKFA